MLSSIEYLQPEPDNCLVMDNVIRDHIHDSNQSLPMIDLSPDNENIENVSINCLPPLTTPQTTPVHVEQQSELELPVIAVRNNSADNIPVSEIDGGSNICLDPSNINMTPNPVIHQPQSVKHVCTVCEKEFLYKRSLTRHMFIHNEWKPFSCAICSKKFARMDMLKLHHSIHLKVKPYQCSSCEKSYCRPSALKFHMKIHSAAQQQKQTDLPPLNSTRSIDTPTLSPISHLQTPAHSGDKSITFNSPVQIRATSTPMRVSHVQYSVFKRPSNAAADRKLSHTYRQQQPNDLVSLKTQTITYQAPMRPSQMQYSAFESSKKQSDESNDQHEQQEDLMSLETQSITTYETPMRPSQLQYSVFKRSDADCTFSYNSQQADLMSLESQSNAYQTPARVKLPVFPQTSSRTADGKLSAVITAVASLYKWSQSLTLNEQTPAISNQ